MTVSSSALDRCLFNALSFLKDGWFDEDIGIVAAVIVDGNVKAAYAASRHIGDNKYSQAEMNVLAEFRKIHSSDPGEGAVMVVTLPSTVKSRLSAADRAALADAGIAEIRYSDATANALLAEQCKKITDCFNLRAKAGKASDGYKNKAVFDGVFKNFDAVKASVKPVR